MTTKNTWYMLNTKETVRANAAQENPFGHGAEESTFLVLVNNETGKAMKVLGTYGQATEEVGDVLDVVQDTGLGHRYMARHKVVGVQRVGGAQEGELPARKVAYWVAK